MKNLSSIQENELDCVLNALFLETYSQTEDESVARFIMDQEYDVIISEKKEKKLLAKLRRGRGGLFLLLLIIGLIITITLPIYFHLTDKKGSTIYSFTIPTNTVTIQSKEINQAVQIIDPVTMEQKSKIETHTITTSTFAANNGGIITISDTIKPTQNITEVKKEIVIENNEKKLPYFDEVGLAYFQVVKENVLLKLIKLDIKFYARIDPGATMYKNKEILVPPFVMSNFPVTNLHYKVFLADLYRQGKTNDLEKCLPKQEVWKEYSCYTLAKNYFENESYNDFPVVNISKEASLMFCKWLEEEMNKTLSGPKRSKLKSSSKKKEVTVRLPYDYEWIYAADAYYAIIPDCGGYNTIYDPSEGLVDKGFFKRTSQVNKRDKNKMTKMDKLSDVNRFGMTENEMITIFKDAMSFKDKKADPADPSFSGKMEDCCLAGHVGELINTKDGGTTIRGCCWKDKEEYLKMAEAYKKFGASPFVGFRVTFITKNASVKDPFW
jgi:uncharacterized protein (UPF0333 family)